MPVGSGDQRPASRAFGAVPTSERSPAKPSDVMSPACQLRFVQLARERRAARAQRLEHAARAVGEHELLLLAQRLPRAGVVGEEERDRRRADRHGSGGGGEPRPAHVTGQRQRVEQRRFVAGDAQRQHVLLPSRGGDLEAVELGHDLLQSIDARQLCRRRGVLPCEEESLNVRRTDRLDLRA